jgi:hypothetical protein
MMSIETTSILRRTKTEPRERQTRASAGQNNDIHPDAHHNFWEINKGAVEQAPLVLQVRTRPKEETILVQ